MQQIMTVPMAGMAPAGIRPAAWSPAPYRPGPSPFMAQPRPRLGQIFGSKSLFDHPAIALAIDAGAISVALMGTKLFKDQTWRTIAWATLIASGLKAVNDLVRLFTLPGPVAAQPQPGGPVPTATPQVAP